MKTQSRHPTRRQLIGLLSAVCLLSLPITASPANASLIPSNIDFGSIGAGGLGDIGGLDNTDIDLYLTPWRFVRLLSICSG